MTDELRDTINTILDVYEIEGIDATSDINMIVGLCKDMAIEAVNTAYDNLGDAYTSKEMYNDVIEAINKTFE